MNQEKKTKHTLITAILNQYVYLNNYNLTYYDRKTLEEITPQEIGARDAVTTINLILKSNYTQREIKKQFKQVIEELSTTTIFPKYHEGIKQVFVYTNELYNKTNKELYQELRELQHGKIWNN